MESIARKILNIDHLDDGALPFYWTADSPVVPYIDEDGETIGLSKKDRTYAPLFEIAVIHPRGEETDELCRRENELLTALLDEVCPEQRLFDGTIPEETTGILAGPEYIDSRFGDVPSGHVEMADGTDLWWCPEVEDGTFYTFAGPVGNFSIRTERTTLPIEYEESTTFENISMLLRAPAHVRKWETR